MKSGGCVGDGLDDRNIRANNVLKKLGSIPSDSDTADVPGANIPNLAEQRFGVFNRISLAKGVAGEEDFFIQA